MRAVLSVLSVLALAGCSHVGPIVGPSQPSCVLFCKKGNDSNTMDTTAHPKEPILKRRR